MTIAHQAATTAKVATDAAGAAASTAIKRTQGAQEALIDAKGSAVAGWKAGWHMPINLVMAPVLAAAAFAGAMAQFEEGTGYVPRTGIAMLHQGEAVIPAPTMEELRGGSGDGSAITINQHNNWNTMSDREFKKQLYRHAEYVVGAVKRHVDRGGS